MLGHHPISAFPLSTIAGPPVLDLEVAMVAEAQIDDVAFVQQFDVSVPLVAEAQIDDVQFSPFLLDVSIVGEAQIDDVAFAQQFDASIAMVAEAQIDDVQFPIALRPVPLVCEAQLDDLALLRTINLDTFLMEGVADLTLLEDQFITVVNPPLSAQQTDPSDSAEFRFTVGGGLVDLSTNSFFNIGELTVTYEGKELTFSEVATPEIGFPTWSPELPVKVEIKFSPPSNFRTIFEGQIRSREHVGENNNETINYRAVGFYQLCNEVTVLNTFGRPDVVFTVGTTVTSVTSEGTDISTTFSKSVREAISDIFSLTGTTLEALDLPFEIGSPGLEQFSSNLKETVTLNNVHFSAALAQLASHESGVKPFVNDESGTWEFHNLLTAPIAVTNIGSVNVESVIFDVTTEDRFTAIRLFSDEEDDLDDQIQSVGEDGLPINAPGPILQRATLTLTKKWLPELEKDWTILKAEQNNPFTLETENYHVFRRWQFDENTVDRFPGTPMKVRQKINFWGVEKWFPLPARVNFTRREVIAKFPAIHRGVPYIPGDSIGPKEVVLTYYPRQSNWTLSQDDSLPNSPVIVSTTAPPEDIISEIRFPQEENTWTGTAFDIFGVQRELIETVSRQEVSLENAIARLRLFKDIVIAGDVPVGGDILREFIWMNRRVQLNHPTKTTGIESTPALFTQYTYSFGKRGQSTLSLTTDVAGLIRT